MKPGPPREWAKAIVNLTEVDETSVLITSGEWILKNKEWILEIYLEQTGKECEGVGCISINKNQVKRLILDLQESIDSWPKR